MQLDFTPDDTDWALLDALQTDAGVPNQTLAARLGISPPTCLRRIRRLREAGWIEREVAILAVHRLPAQVTALVEVSLDRQDAATLDAFERRALDEPAVQQCYRVSPGPDFMLVVTVADLPAYQALAERLFTRDTSVRNVKSFFSLKRAVFRTRLPLPASPSAPSAAAASRQS